MNVLGCGWHAKAAQHVTDADGAGAPSTDLSWSSPTNRRTSTAVKGSGAENVTARDARAVEAKG